MKQFNFFFEGSGLPAKLHFNTDLLGTDTGYPSYSHAQSLTTFAKSMFKNSTMSLHILLSGTIL